ncbi:hypothetical protein [Microbacterium pygmaeum]|uniref:Uncharacterized protein n=1 Tax=Microbacterium pygmaeum TaxID=370764 RepID=A0A1G7VU89_9MICO|nr:hypothetical protein [Microbacterium pygmaeum]SDG63247.1 hypothetical protein SAMN04489810_0837 [Microbacterium pygmaeum]
MPDLVLNADPEIWSLVPGWQQALAWREQRTATTEAERRADVFEAATLALRTRAEVDATHVLFLDAVGHRLLGALAVFAYDDVPAASSRTQAEEIARAMVPSAWEVHSIVADLGGGPGWRVTVIDAPLTDDGAQVALVEAVWTVYVLEVAGRLVVALLSAMSPPNAALAQVHAERVLVTMNVVQE